MKIFFKIKNNKGNFHTPKSPRHIQRSWWTWRSPSRSCSSRPCRTRTTSCSRADTWHSDRRWGHLASERLWRRHWRSSSVSTTCCSANCSDWANSTTTTSTTESYSHSRRRRVTASAGICDADCHRSDAPSRKSFVRLSRLRTTTTTKNTKILYLNQTCHVVLLIKNLTF